ncbi:MAG TPA: rRNA cytosine-C5-methyltransferase [Paludibacteraceae bacterium]|nr:rRNA cytosine-C5-methyltransferase [Paludibacteraceae bacterium]HRS68074.1 rRNA cytosine-C5-methyltransferase [Paludibacteraceae bacterium]
MKKLSLPADFIAQMEPFMGKEWQQFEAALNLNPVVSIRMNDKYSLTQTLEQVPWCPQGFYLKNRPNFTLDPLFHSGAYYVQEASSMFVYQALMQHISTDSLILDMCAAPGGKSTLISQYLSDNGLLICNEFIRSRSQILAENIHKWGNDNVIVTNNSPHDYESLVGLFDAVLVDAPCSGEGMFRKDEVAITEWSLFNVQQCAIRQQDILKSAWKCLKDNGILIYSTCTYNSQENEENVQWLCKMFGAEPLTIQVDPKWGVTESEQGYHFYPHKTEGEGFFLAVLRKPKSIEQPLKIKSKQRHKDKKLISLENYIKETLSFELIEKKQLIYAFKKTHLNILELFLEKLNVIHFGVAVAEQKGRDFIPQAGLALSKMLNREAFNSVEVNWQQAIAFLRTEALFLPDSPKGILLICFQNLPLGWVKNIGNRSNNLYPEHWRIRMQIDVTETAPTVI